MNSYSLRREPLRPALTIRQDTRGSILLPGLAMVAVLVVGVLHISEVAENILGRIAVQTQADGIALEGAIWHAQGMNLLVTLNIVMAVIFTAFLAIRLVVLALATLLAIVVIGSAIASFFSFGAAAGAGAQVAQLLGRALHQMHRIEQRVAKPVMNALKVTSDAERTVAAAVPWVAAALPVSRLSGNPTAMVFSVSMLPNILEQKFKDLGPKLKPGRAVTGNMNPRTQFPARLGSFPGGSPGKHRKSSMIGSLIQRGHKKVKRANKGSVGPNNHADVKVLDMLTGSLPAQDEDIFMVCSRSAEGVSAIVTRILLGPLKIDDATATTISSTFGKVIGSLPTVACMPAEQLSAKVQDTITQQVQEKCDEEREKYENTPEKPEHPNPKAPPPPVRHRKRKWTQGLQIACEKDQKKKAAESLGEDPSKGRAAAEDIKTAAIWGEMLVPRQSPLLHVWSIHMDEKWPYFPGDGEAEFYHSCAGTSDKDGRSCADNSLWRYGWKADTIPLRSFNDEMVAEVGEFAQGWVNRAMGKAIQGVVARLASFLPPSMHKPGGTGKHADPAARSVQDALNRQLAGLRHPEAGNGYWSRKFLGPAIGNWLGGQARGATQAVFR